MGSDKTVVNAARVSFNKEISEMRKSDEGLIAYLAKHGHWTPFGHVQLQFRIAAPVFIARQLGKHQVGLVWNEVSRRYVDSNVSFYTPPVWRKKADNKKQGSSDDIIVQDDILFSNYEKLLKASELLYDILLEKGAAPEQARMVLPQSMMTEWIWTGSLAAFGMTYEAEIATATANLENYLYNSVGVSEHPDIIKSIDALVEKIALAKEKILVVEEKLNDRC